MQKQSHHFVVSVVSMTVSIIVTEIKQEVSTGISDKSHFLLKYYGGFIFFIWRKQSEIKTNNLHDQGKGWGKINEDKFIEINNSQKCYVWV